MKKGCLVLLAILALSYAGYYSILKGTEYDSNYWVPGLLALGATLICANIHGIILALQQKKAFSKPRSSWQDGELIGVSGKLQAIRAPISAPVSGVPSTIIEYSIRPPSSSSDSNAKAQAHYMGFLMAPCTIQGQHGSVKVIGFPLLAQVKENTFNDPESCARAGAYLKTCSFQVLPSNPMKLLGEISTVLSDDDGDVRCDYAASHATAHFEENAADFLDGSMFSFEETTIPNGSVVTAFGTYSFQKQAIDIGSGMSKLSHTIQLGESAVVLSGNMRKTLFFTLFWLIVVGVGNWYVFRIPLAPYVERYIPALNRAIE